MMAPWLQVDLTGGVRREELRIIPEAGKRVRKLFAFCHQGRGEQAHSFTGGSERTAMSAADRFAGQSRHVFWEE
jgi:hypothetical protein